MKKITALILSLCMTVLLFGGCAPADSDSRIQVICTTFAAYDWTREIVGENSDSINLTMIPDSSTDMHSYQASADDIISISSCDILVYTGGQSEQWISDAVAANKNASVVNLMEILGSGVMAEEHIEGMEHEHKEDGHADEDEYDEHVWLSVRNAMLFCEKIADALSAADADNADSYTQNALAYTARLSELDSQYIDAVYAAEKKTLLFGDRFPFLYLVKDYGINYFAAFSGCSAETEASFETVIFLAGKADELGLDCICTIDGSQADIARTIAENTNSKSKRILSLDSMQSSGMKEINDGKTYISVMEQNLEIIKQALS